MRGWVVVAMGLGLAGGCAPVAAECCRVCVDAEAEDERDGEPGEVGDEEEPDEEAPDEIDPDAHLDDCDAGEPTWCLSIWQAHAKSATLGYSGESDVVVRSGSAPYRTCVDQAFPFYAGSHVQDGFVDPGVVGEGFVLEPRESLYLAPQQDWWCVDESQPTEDYASLGFLGETVPPRLAALVDADRDDDGDGTSDREQWLDDRTTKAQDDIWRALERHAVLTVGKTAEPSEGAVAVQLTSRNLGYVEGRWTVVDRVPAGWRVIDVRPADAEVVGSAQTGWRIEWSGSTPSRGVRAMDYTIERDVPVDRVYVELPAATLDDGVDVISSMPAAIYDLDVDGDGEIACR